MLYKNAIYNEKSLQEIPIHLEVNLMVFHL
jgi:hypothetical protein